jgi:GTP cyclohydrolase I
MSSPARTHDHHAQWNGHPGLEGRVDYELLVQVGRELISALGYDPDAHEWRETPRRFAENWKEFIEYEAGVTDSLFDAPYGDQVVVVSDIRVWSICQHHLLPFWCDVSIGYVPRESLLGLSKFSRVAHKHAHRPQLQERMCGEVADDISRLTRSPDVAVIARGQHLCMTMRGIRSPGTVTSTVMRGLFRTDDRARTELLRAAGL